MASFKGRPCLPIYQPTHRRLPDNQQDPIRFRHLVKALLDPFKAIAQDNDFWSHTQDGLVCLSAQILLLGAEFTCVYARTFGSRSPAPPGIRPSVR